MIFGALLAGCAAPQEKITWNTPREATPAEPAQTSPEAADKSATGPCREFQETIMIDGKPQRAYGTACRQPDGTWKKVAMSDKPTTEAPVSSFPYQGPGGYAAYPRYYPRYYPRHHFGFGFGVGHHHSHFGYGVHW